MADKKISQLGSTTTPNDPDLFAIVQGGVTNKITFADIKSGLNISLSDVLASGNITGSNDILISNGQAIYDLSQNSYLDTGSGSYIEIGSGSSYINVTDGNLEVYSNDPINGNISFGTATGVLYFDSAITRFNQATASTVPYFDASKNLVSSAITPTELGYLSGATSGIQSQIDALVTGLSWKQAVRVATTVNGILATSFENGDTVDGVVLATGNRILIKNQTSQAENGIYIVNASGAPTRSADMNSGSEFPSATVAVSEGTTNQDTQWVCNNDSVTIGVTNIIFVAVGGTTYVGTTNRITLTGNVIDIGTDVVTLTGSQTLTNKTLTALIVGTSLTANYATASTVPYFDASKNLISSSVTPTELGYISGVTSSIQTQLSSKEVALTFSTGLTRSTNTITANLNVGVSGGQTVIGGTAVGDGLTYKGTTGNGTTTVAAHVFNVGNNGATTAAKIYNNGDINLGNKINTTQRLVRIGQDTAWMDFGSLVGATSLPAIYLGVTTPAVDNYNISGSAGPLYLNAGTSASTVEMRVIGVQKYIVGQTTHSWFSTAATSNSNPVYSFVTPASTGQTAGTETNGFLFDMAANGIQHASNTAITSNTDFYVRRRTHAFATTGGSIATAATVAIEGAPVQGTNWNSGTPNLYALWIKQGASAFAGDVKVTSVGGGLYVSEGTNATMGTATLTAGTVTVSTTKVTANSRIFLTVNGGTLTNVGAVYISARTAGTSFTITSANVLDASNVAWMIVEPN